MSYDPTNFRDNRLTNSEHIRFLNYYDTIQQEIATHGASQYVGVDPAGKLLHYSLDLQILSEQSRLANDRYLRYTTLQMDLPIANATYDQMSTVANWNHCQTIMNELKELRYEAPFMEDQRREFLGQQLIKAKKETAHMTSAIAQVFQYLFATVDSFLSNKIQAFSSRTGPAHPPYVNLIDALAFLCAEMKGNTLANREACAAQLDKVNPASTLEEFRFVLDVFVSVIATIASSIRLYGGSGMLSNSQVHYKLLSKINPDAPCLTFVRIQLSAQPAETTSLSDMRNLIKPELDRVIDPLRAVDRSTNKSTSRWGAVHHLLSDPNATSITNIAVSVSAYNQDQPSAVPVTQGMVNRAVEQAVSLALNSLENRPTAGRKQEVVAAWQSSLGENGLRRQMSTSSGSSNPVRHKTVCTEYLWANCYRTNGPCKFEHPPHLYGSMCGTDSDKV